MNKEAYCRGFAKAAGAAGVDAVALAKYVMLTKRAWDENGDEYRKWLSSPAGIGTWDGNAASTLYPAGRAEEGGRAFVSGGMKPVDKGSFMSGAFENAKAYGKGENVPGSPLNVLRAIAPAKISGEPNNRQITNEELDKMRYDQARLAASQFADKRSEKYEALVKDLEAAGRRNEESYKSGKGVQRRPLSLPSAKGLNISKDKLKMLEAFQNSMVRNGNGSAAGNIA